MPTVTSYPTLRDTISALPWEEAMSRRALYTDDEWENSWELSAYPHQLPPISDDWTAWTVVAPPGCGGTTAGLEWVKSLLFKAEKDVRILALFTYRNDVSRIGKMLFDQFLQQQIINNYSFKDRSGELSFLNKDTGTMLTLRATSSDPNTGVAFTHHINSDYIWGDRIDDARMLMQLFPLTKKFVFTQPVGLPEHSVVSRAGSPRAY